MLYIAAWRARDSGGKADGSQHVLESVTERSMRWPGDDGPLPASPLAAKFFLLSRFIHSVPSPTANE